MIRNYEETFWRVLIFQKKPPINGTIYIVTAEPNAKLLRGMSGAKIYWYFERTSCPVQGVVWSMEVFRTWWKNYSHCFSMPTYISEKFIALWCARSFSNQKHSSCCGEILRETERLYYNRQFYRRRISPESVEPPGTFCVSQNSDNEDEKMEGRTTATKTLL